MSGTLTGADWMLAPSADGGWALETGDPATTITVRRERSEHAWRASGPGERSLRIVGTPPAGFAALVADDDEIARSAAPRGMERDTRLRHLLLADGRLFRVVRRAAAASGFDLLGWETPGSYLEARRARRGWTVARTPAGRAVDDLATAAVLFCMEIVDADADGVAHTDGT